jgi:methionine transaminase
MERGHNQYAPMAGLPLLRTRIADKMNRSYPGLGIHPDEVTITAGATQAIFCAIAAFVRAGEEVILIEPCYDSYRPSVETVGGVPVVYALQAPDYRIDWEAVGRLITPRTRMICVNTPCNPTGRLLQPADLDALAALLRGTDILVLSDEVYEHLVFDGHTHHPLLQHPELRPRTLATYSFGKTFHNTGWKVGYCVAPAPLTQEFRKIHQFNVFCVNHPVQAALADFLDDPDTYNTLPAFYQQKRDFFRQAMTASRFKALACEGAYFQVYDYSAISDAPDVDFCRYMTEAHCVAAIPMSAFYSDGRDDKVIRLCFAKTEDLLALGAARLQAVTGR